MTIKKKKPWPHQSFYMTPSDKEMLDFLSNYYGINRSALIRRLLTEAYSILKYVEQK